MNQKREEQFNCYDCDYQGTSSAQLKKHISLRHSANGERQDSAIQCKICGDKFSEKWHLMSHRKAQHISNVAPCKNEKVGKCSYSAEKCWWNHDLSQDLSNENIKCFICNEKFESKADMMSHRKKKTCKLRKKMHSICSKQMQFQK